MSVAAEPEAAPAPAAAGERHQGPPELLFRVGLPLGVAACCLLAWHASVAWSRHVSPGTSVLPTPLAAVCTS